MANWFDLLLDEDFDLLVKDGDFVVGDSKQQDIELILVHNKGAFFNTPTVGVGVLAAGNRRITNVDDIMREARLQLSADGLKNLSITLDKSKYIIYGDR